MPRENRCRERIDAEREYMPRENRGEKSRVHLSCQAQYLRGSIMRFILRGRRSIC